MSRITWLCPPQWMLEEGGGGTLPNFRRWQKLKPRPRRWRWRWRSPRLPMRQLRRRRVQRRTGNRTTGPPSQKGDGAQLNVPNNLPRPPAATPHRQRSQRAV
ncbi:unnamed protein product [Pylaiella littoralis]